MAGTTMNTARSNSGCWTCRVRKKKCDESRPNCSTCSSLSLQCFGYGEKPVWMDNGPLQKEQALRIKSAVGKNNHSRKKSRALHCTPLPFPGMDIISSNSLATPAPSLDISSSEEHSGVFALSENLPEDWGQFDSWSSDLDISSIMTGRDPLTPELTFDQVDWGNSTLIQENSLNGTDPMSSGTSRSTQSYDSGLNSSKNVSMVQHIGPSAECIFHNGIHQGGTTSVPEPLFMESPTHRPRPGKSTLEPSSPLNSFVESTHPSQNEIEDNLFMWYFDEVFHIQFRFYNIPTKRSRGWLFSTIRGDRSAYHASLALSQYISRSTTDPPLLQALSSKNNHYDMAQRELAINTGAARESNTFSRMTSLMQMLFYELFAGGSGDWQRYFRSATPWVLQFGKTTTSSTEAGSYDVGYETEQQQNTHDQMHLQPRHNLQIQVLLGSFIWFDIMAAASTRSTPSFNFDHKRVLDSFGINLQCLFGCSNRVLELMLEIIGLDKWKQESEKTRQLSMIELVKRGARIEENIGQYTEVLGKRASVEPTVLKDGTNTLLPRQTEITQIFALAAQTYLHVVISGAHPELPEIAETISKTIDKFNSLSDPSSLRNLVWPFCVTGCLATKAQKVVIRDLIFKAGITFSTSGTCWQAFQIVEMCWELRESCPQSCDWVFAMKKRSCSVLLA